MAFGFIKKLSKPQPVDLTHFEDGVVYFTSAIELTPQKTYNVTARLPEGEEFGAVISVIKRLESDRYTGFVQQPQDANRYLGMLLPGPFADRRRAPRVRKKLRLGGREVPGFMAMTINVSSTGLCIQANGPIEEGERLGFELDLDLAGTSALTMVADVKWCAGNEVTRQYLIGLEFVDLSRAQEQALLRFFERLEQINSPE